MSIYDTEAGMQALENRYGAAFTQYLADQMAAVHARSISFLDVKQLNDDVAAYRTRLRGLIAACRAAQGDADTALLRRQIAELRAAYRHTLLNSRVMMDEYMRRLKTDGIASMQIVTQYTKAA